MFPFWFLVWLALTLLTITTNGMELSACRDKHLKKPVPKQECGPFPKLNVNQCSDLIARCLCQHGIRLKWTKKDCDGSRGMGGCQCDDYCGYPCEKKCVADPKCSWNGSFCSNRNTGMSGQMLTCYTEAPTQAPTFPRPTQQPTLAPTRATQTPTVSQRPSLAPTKSTPKPTSTLQPSAPPTCQTKPLEVDIIWLIDESRSVGAANYDKMKSFISTFSLRLDFAPNRTRSAYVAYSTQVRSQIDFNHQAASDQAKFIAQVNALKYVDGASNTKVALEAATKMIQDPRRATFPRKSVVILATDGKPTGTGGYVTAATVRNAETAAAVLKQQPDLVLIVLRIGNFDDKFLSTVADYVVGARGYSELEGVLDPVAGEVLC